MWHAVEHWSLSIQLSWLRCTTPVDQLVALKLLNSPARHMLVVYVSFLFKVKCCSQISDKPKLISRTISHYRQSLAVLLRGFFLTPPPPPSPHTLNRREEIAFWKGPANGGAPSLLCIYLTTGQMLFKWSPNCKYILWIRSRAVTFRPL